VLWQLVCDDPWVSSARVSLRHGAYFRKLSKIGLLVLLLEIDGIAEASSRLLLLFFGISIRSSREASEGS